MNFGLFTMFEIREGATQAETFDDWFDLVEAADHLGLDSLWLGESHFRANRAVISVTFDRCERGSGTHQRH